MNFYRRCLQFGQRADELLPPPRSRGERRILQRASEVLEAVRESAFGLVAVAERLERSQATFGELRNLLRLRHDELRGRAPHEPLTAVGCVQLIRCIPIGGGL